MSETRGDRGVWNQTALRVRRLCRMEDASRLRAELAKLRHGVGQTPGDDPALWDVLFDGLPEDMLSRTGEPTREEWAIYLAMTLYALHQQGRDPRREPMQVEGRSLGGAAAALVAAQGEESRERIARRFNQVAAAADIGALAHYLRALVLLLRGEGIGLDYPLLAADLYRYQSPERAQSVRLRWGQDFYRRSRVQNGENTDDP